MTFFPKFEGSNRFCFPKQIEGLAHFKTKIISKKSYPVASM